MFATLIAFALPTSTGWLSALYAAAPIIFALVILESLLSVDNALVLAQMVHHLPEKQRTLALRVGIIGAYAMRGACLVFASIILRFSFLNVVAALFLLYLAFGHLGTNEDEENERNHKAVGFWHTVLLVELADLSFSVDNIAAAVAMSPKLWIVCSGVFIGILAMRFVSGWFVKLIDLFPILAKVAYVLVGWIGLQLLLHHYINFELSPLGKFLSVIAIAVFGVIYSKVPVLQKILDPVFGLIGKGMGATAGAVDFVLGKLCFWKHESK